MQNNIELAIQEIISAQSALNMEPKPLPVSEGTFLSETDHWAKHSYEHLNKAIQVLMSINEGVTNGI